LLPLTAPAQTRPVPPDQPETPGQFIDDAAITAKVKAELIKDDTVKAGQVNVTTSQGIVQLSGSVDTLAAKQQAEVIAGRVAGVKSVMNSLQVKE
jgi:osmotically-inducible protein OsmY